MSCTPTELAQAQLDAYNAHDLEAFLACYAEEVEIRNFPSGELTCAGRDAMAERYGPMFAEKTDLHAALVKRVAHDAIVIDEESVTGLRDDETVTAVAMYEVHDDLIQNVWFVR